MSTTPPDDDEAFRWEGDEDERAARTRRRRTRATAVAPAAAESSVDDHAPSRVLVEAADEHDADDDGPAISSLGIVVLGIFGGIALLETIGWIRGELRLPFTTDVSVGLTAATSLTYVLEILGRIAAVASAPLWFLLVLWRIPASPRRVLWLLIGALLLVPWPLLVSAA